MPSGSRGPRLINNTIAYNNSSTQIFADGFDAQVELINNIVIGNSGQTAVFCGSFNDTNPPIFKSNDIFSSLGTAYGGICTDQTGVNGNISADPLFIDPNYDKYKVQSTSPTIDMGNNTDCPTIDFRGIPRPQTNCDLGIYEFIPEFFFSNSNYVVKEDIGVVTVTVTLNLPLTVTAKADYKNDSASSSATAGDDYLFSSGTLTFTPGIITKNFTVTVLEDDVPEFDETIKLLLANATASGIIVRAEDFSYITILGPRVYLPLILK